MRNIPATTPWRDDYENSAVGINSPDVIRQGFEDDSMQLGTLRKSNAALKESHAEPDYVLKDVAVETMGNIEEEPVKKDKRPDINDI